ncbi:Phosphoesterase [Minicystis rosea]|nr:Phosphoesterase [Minicystis rosea]
MTRDALLLLVAALVSGLALVVAALAARRARTRVGRALLRALAAAAAFVFGVVVWGRFIEPRWIEVTHTRVAVSSSPPLRLTVLADFHAGRVGAEVVAHAVALANETDPDIVLLAGDYVTGYDLSEPKAHILEALRPLRARRGVFAVLGNHDSEPYTVPTPRAADIARFLEGLGFIVLRNRWISVAPGVILIGLDEVQSGNIDPPRAFHDAPEGARIVLTHDWHGLAREGVGRFDLAITGHTHGGQICAPLLGWCPFAQNNEPFLAGLHNWPRGGKLFINRGIGESAVLMRVASRPEVSVVDIESRK